MIKVENERIPVVSIICNTFNQGDYIKDALEGFVSQKTDFPFEILVHDDASTDKTPEIIRSYEQKYPDLIFPIYQAKNQFSQDIKISQVHQFPRARGRYLAFCEGDDYWTDPQKLQKQFEVMEAHPELDICAHRTVKIDGTTGEQLGEIAAAKENAVLTVQQVIEGGGSYVSTCSLFFRKEMTENPPAFRRQFNNDYSLQISGALRGGMLFLSDCMAAYRWKSAGSWSNGREGDIQRKTKENERTAALLKQLDVDTDGRYAASVEKVLRQNEFFLLEAQRDYRAMLAPKYRTLFLQFPLKYRLVLMWRSLFKKRQ